MKSEMRVIALVAAVVLPISILTAYAFSEGPSDSLATPDSFASITDTAQRSAALFTELGKVLTHPRCVNCHPAGDHPRQGEQGRLHQPPVARGVDGHGLPAMRCSICHQQANFEPGRVPGHPAWHLAPREMAWEGKTLAEICVQIKDPKRNGGRSVEDLIITSAPTLWSGGLGRPATAASPLPARRSRPAHLWKHG